MATPHSNSAGAPLNQSLLNINLLSLPQHLLRLSLLLKMPVNTRGISTELKLTLRVMQLSG